MTEVTCKTCGAVADISASGDPPVTWQLDVTSDFRAKCRLMQERLAAEPDLEEFDCPDLLAAMEAEVERSRQLGSQQPRPS